MTHVIVASAWRIAKRHGTVLEMIEDPYGAYLPEGDAIDLVLLDRNRNRGKTGRKVKPLSKTFFRKSIHRTNIITYECEEGDLNPERDFSRDASHSSDSPEEPRASGQSPGRFSNPVPTQLSLDFTQKTGTVPVVESRRRRRRRP